METQTPAHGDRRCAVNVPGGNDAQTTPAPTAQATRRRLPNRRASEIIQVEDEGRSWRVALSRFDDGRIAEVFVDTAKYGSDIALHSSQSAILASLALQFGASVDDLMHTVGGPIRAALKLAEAGK